MITEEYISMCNCREVQINHDKVKSCCNKDCQLFYIEKLWVPRFQEIVEMIDTYVKCEYRILQEFYYWCAGMREKKIETVKGRQLTELFLMFFMHKNYNKEWDKNNKIWVELIN